MARSSLAQRWIALSPYTHALLRIVPTVDFITHGTMKLFAWPIGVPPNGGTVPVFTQAWVGGCLELVLGTLVLIGLFTRPAAFILAGEMAVAYFQFHMPNGFWPLVNQGTPAVVFCFIFLYLSSAGPGPWSVDALRMRARAPEPTPDIASLRA